MNKKKTIALKDPRLQAIRNSLREVINQTVLKERRELFESMKKQDRGSTDGYKRYWDLYAERSVLKSYLRNSIIECPACFAIDRDMRYNPYDKAWYCVDCYKLIGDMYHVTMVKKAKGEYIGLDYDEELARSFTE